MIRKRILLNIFVNIFSLRFYMSVKNFCQKSNFLWFIGFSELFELIRAIAWTLSLWRGAEDNPFSRSRYKNKFGQLIDASFRPIFSIWFEDRRTDQQTHLPVEMQFYISVISWAFLMTYMTKNLHFCNLKKNALPTDPPTDGPTDGQTLL